MTATTATADLSTEDLHAAVDQLIKRIAEIAAVRDLALKMASQATKDLVRVRDEMNARLEDRNVLISSLRIAADAKDNEIRRLTTQLHGLALADEDRQRRADAAQQQPEATTPWRRLLKRIGNRKDRP